MYVNNYSKLLESLLLKAGLHDESDKAKVARVVRGLREIYMMW